MKIVLIGYMASGKSTIGRELSKLLNTSFIDLDSYIEQEERTTISDLFLTKGEVYFRKKEHLYLHDILKRQSSFVLALGGGTPCFSNNIELLKDKTDVVVIYLKTSITTIVSRLQSSTGRRPLVSHLKTAKAFQEFVGKHLFERTPFYNAAADITVNADISKETVIEQIISQLF